MLLLLPLMGFLGPYLGYHGARPLGILGLVLICALSQRNTTENIIRHAYSAPDIPSLVKPDGPPPKLSELRDVIPDSCFQQSYAKSLGHLAWDLVRLVCASS